VILEQALSLAEPEGYVRLFADEGEPIPELLQRYVIAAASSDRVQPERSVTNWSYAARLLDAMLADGHASQVTSSPASPHLQLGHARPAGLVEPLSDRELEVLRFLTSALSSFVSLARSTEAPIHVPVHPFEG
jgi:LuxR family maltose regulon positive regulatory protein